MTTVLCVWVKGHVKYPSEYVVRLDAMVRRWMPEPYQFACLTDRPWQLPQGIRAIPVPGIGSLNGWWAKVRVFDERHKFRGRMLYLDLDTLIVSPLAPIVEYPAPFALIPHSGRFEGLDGKSVVKRFNSSVMVWDAGTQNDLFRTWAPAVADRLWGDQDWIGEQAPGAAVMPAEWFPRISQLKETPPSGEAKVVLVKTPKNLEAAKLWPWAADAWRAA